LMGVLEKGRIKVKKLKINPNKAVVVSRKAASLLAERSELNLIAKKAYKSYVRSIHLMPNKDIFRVEELPLDEYATSLGLASTPNLRFLKQKTLVDRENFRKAKNVDRKLERLKEEIRKERLESKLVGIQIPTKIVPLEKEESDEEDGILVLKKKKKKRSIDDSNAEDDSTTPPLPTSTTNKDLKQYQLAQEAIRKPKRIRIDALSNGENKRITFNDEGDEEGGNGLISELATTTTTKSQTDAGGATTVDLADANQEYLRRVRERLDGTKELDLQEEKDRIRAKHKKKKRKDTDDNDVNDGDEEEDGGVVYTLPDDDESESGEDGDGGSGESSESDSDGESVSGSSDDGGGGSDSDSSSSEDEEDMKAKEELALALIRGDA